MIFFICICISYSCFFPLLIWTGFLSKRRMRRKPRRFPKASRFGGWTPLAKKTGVGAVCVSYFLLAVFRRFPADLGGFQPLRRGRCYHVRTSCSVWTFSLSLSSLSLSCVRIFVCFFFFRLLFFFFSLLFPSSLLLFFVPFFIPPPFVPSTQRVEKDILVFERSQKGHCIKISHAVTSIQGALFFFFNYDYVLDK